MYKFNPLDHGFEPISYFPELEYAFPIVDCWYVKVICYSDSAYWYAALRLFGHDDRLQINGGVHSWYQSNKNSVIHQEYQGLITSDKFAKELLTHLFATTTNDGIKYGIERYNQNLGPEMREKFKKQYA